MILKSFSILCMKLYQVSITQYVQIAFRKSLIFSAFSFYPSLLYIFLYFYFFYALQPFAHFQHIFIFQPKRFFNYFPFIYVQNIYMNPTTSILPKAISSSAHSFRSSFKFYNEPSTQKLVVPFVKLQHLFIKKTKGKRHHHKFSEAKLSVHKGQNVSYINLGMDEEQSRVQAIPKGTFPNRLKTKEVRTERNDQALLNSTFHKKPKRQKRNRHQSLVNMVDKYTLFAPNGQKVDLQKNKKKLIKSLNKNQNSQKNNQFDCSHGLTFVSYFKTHSNIDSLPGGAQMKPKEQQSVNCNEKGLNKRKIQALKHQNSQNFPINSYALNSLNTTQPTQKCKKKLTRRYSKQNTTLNTIYPQFRAGQKSRLRKSKALQFTRQKKQNTSPDEIKQKLESNFFMRQKFKLAKFIKTFEAGSIQDSVIDEPFQKWESSKDKLDKLLKCRKKVMTKDKNPLLTPWDLVPSEKELDLNP